MDLHYWKDKYVRARAAYGDVLSAIDKNTKYYDGTRDVEPNPNTQNPVTKVAHLVRNMAKELTEAQVDSNIPTPKVSALKSEDTWLAQKCEHKLNNENDRMNMQAKNDMAERFVYPLGAAVYHIEWDNTKHTRTTTGEVDISVLHPKQLIPQAGVYEIQKMDYFFLVMAQTKEYIKTAYGVDVDLEGEEHPEARGNDKAQEDTQVTQIICYYRNKSGNVGRLSWVNDILLEDLPDYHARRLKRCNKCGNTFSGEACDCGCTSGESVKMQEETIMQDIVLGNGNIIPAGTVLPYYTPDVYPVVVRRNISQFGSLIGASDIDMIRDQQDALKKVASKVIEKILMGGSALTRGKDTKVVLDGEELKEIVFNSPADVSMFGVHNLQPNISQDAAVEQTLVGTMKDTLGITDSFLGRRDNTATSGVAKQLAVQQSAGRLESKRIMKAAAYAEIYEIVLKYLVAFADEARPVVHKDIHGKDEFSLFSRYDFLEQDVSGEWFYNVDFLFSVDTSGQLAENRAAMWEELGVNFQRGVFGDPADMQTQIMYWQMMEEQHYPYAGRVKAKMEARFAEQQQLAQQQALMEQLALENQQLMEQTQVQQGQLMAAEDIKAQQDSQRAAEQQALLQELGAISS